MFRSTFWGVGAPTTTDNLQQPLHIIIVCTIGRLSGSTSLLFFFRRFTDINAALEYMRLPSEGPASAIASPPPPPTTTTTATAATTRRRGGGEEEDEGRRGRRRRPVRPRRPRPPRAARGSGGGEDWTGSMTVP